MNPLWRGVFFGLLLSVPLYAVIGLLLWVVFHG